MFAIGADGSVEGLLEHPHHWGVAAFSKANGTFLGEPFPDDRSQRAADVAAYVQSQFSMALEEVIEILASAHKSQNVALSGGIGLNCVTNEILRLRYGSDHFFAFPGSSDSGLALGNALFGQWALEGRFPKPVDRSMRFGRRYGAGEIERALERAPDTVPPGSLRTGNLDWHHSANPAEDAAELIESGALVAWWQGRSEFGPRALGGRSLLASPSRAGVRDALNQKVKKREWFRPFAPSVLASASDTILQEAGFYPYMNQAPAVSELGRQLIPEAVHVDSTARIQTVATDFAPELTLVLQALQRRGQTPAVINTSFNVQEPIVETPGDAIATFLRSGIDVLILDQFVCRRRTPD